MCIKLSTPKNPGRKIYGRKITESSEAITLPAEPQPLLLTKNVTETVDGPFKKNKLASFDYTKNLRQRGYCFYLILSRRNTNKKN